MSGGMGGVMERISSCGIWKLEVSVGSAMVKDLKIENLKIRPAIVIDGLGGVD